MHQNISSLYMQQKICKTSANNLTKLYCQRLNKPSVNGEIDLQLRAISPFLNRPRMHSVATMCNQQADSLSHDLEGACVHLLLSSVCFLPLPVHCGFLFFLWSSVFYLGSFLCVEPTSATILEMTSLAARKERQWFICLLSSGWEEEGTDRWWGILLCCESRWAWPSPLRVWNGRPWSLEIISLNSGV